MSEKKVVRLHAPKYKVYVIGGGYDYIRLLYQLGFDGAKGIADADILLFTGGEDVDPGLYGEQALRTTMFNRNRDDKEVNLFNEAKEKNIPMVGICRGGQFLNVMNNGKMWQHVNGHTGDHPIWPVGPKNTLGEAILATSTHHQMMRPGEKGTVLAIGKKATKLQSFGQDVERPEPVSSDTEVVWYPDTKCLCFQPHPEMRGASDELVKYFDELMDNYIIPSVLENQTKKVA